VLAQQLERRGNFAGALEIYRALVKKHPNASDLHFAIGHALVRMANYEQAQPSLERAIRIDPRKARYHNFLATSLSAQSKTDQALAAATRAMELEPDAPSNIFILAEMLRLNKRAEESFELLEPVVSKPDADLQVIALFGRTATAIGKPERAAEILQRALQRDDVNDETRARLSFALGTALDKLKDYDSAWPAFETANRCRAIGYDAQGEDAWADETMRLWSKERLPTLPRARDASEIPVFVLGMPRSGTTLVEQIISAHPRAHGAGERQSVFAVERELIKPNEQFGTRLERLEALKPAVIDRVSRRELRQLRKTAPKAERIADKMMQNFLNLGLIWMLYPGARVIHCVRDPLDTCLSNYFQDFASPPAQAFSYSIDGLAHYYGLYRRMMRHWKNVLDTPILDVVYEQMVDDQDAQSRRIIEFLGLEWDDACLSFHKAERPVVTLSAEQVRQPMYRSSRHRYRNYERHIGPLREALERQGVRTGPASGGE